MRRNEFIAETASRVGVSREIETTEAAIQWAERLAKKLEDQGLAPWTDKRIQDATPEELTKFAQDLFEAMTGAARPATPPLDGFIQFTLVDCKTPSRLCDVLRDVLKGLPTNVGLLAGRWELGFRPAQDTGGLIRGGAIPPARA